MSRAFNAAATNVAWGAGIDRKRSQFFEAVMNDDAKAVLRILEDYPDALAWKDAEGLTGLMVAARDGASESASVLLKAGADIRAQNANGSTPLMFAAYSGKAVVAEMLVKAGADVNHENNKGHTPVMSAAAHGYKNTLKVLLEAGAETRLPDREGLTALDYAKDNGHKEVVEVLMRRRQLQEEKGPVATAFGNSAPRKAESIPAPANVNTPAAEPALTPEQQRRAEADANTSELRKMEERMRRAKLF